MIEVAAGVNEWQEAPEELADLIEACMEVDPDARPSSHQIFEALQVPPPLSRLAPPRPAPPHEQRAHD